MQTAATSSVPYDVTAIGFGCMNLSHAYGPPQPREVAERVIRRALDLGVTHFDTAALVRLRRQRAARRRDCSASRPDNVIVASKCGLFGRDGKRVIDGRPESIRAVCERVAAQSARPIASICTTCIAGTSGSHRGKRRRPGGSDARRQDPRDWPVGSRCGDAAQGARRASHRGAAIRILAVDAQSGNRGARGVPPPRRAFVAFSPLGRGILTGGLRSPAELVRRRHPARHAALPEPQLRGKPPPARAAR